MKPFTNVDFYVDLFTILYVLPLCGFMGPAFPELSIFCILLFSLRIVKLLKIVKDATKIAKAFLEMNDELIKTRKELDRIIVLVDMEIRAMKLMEEINKDLR